MTDFTYTVVRSDRKTSAIQITSEGVFVRVPKKSTDAEVKRLVESHRKWLEKHLAKQEKAHKAMEGITPLTAEEFRALADKALKYIPERTAYWAKIMGVSYGRITIRSQRTKWGSCSAKKNLNFNCLLMLAPPEAIDSVIVHELAHLKEMNHSPRFYAAVKAVFPEYDKWNGWLKENGAAIMLRLPR
ncbi:MAG: M48 family metallopeptidase [Clostridia bacterium]|nr:M48 family metallopeptidase [Clostridia bacterium]